VKVDFGHKTSALTEDHMEDCNGWELASRAGLEWRLKKSVVGVYHSIHTAKRSSCTRYEWRGEPKRCSKALLPFRRICKPSLQNLIVMGFQQPVVVDSCHTS
jgi:hypothetical protein